VATRATARGSSGRTPSSSAEGDYELKDDWSATVGDNLVVRKDGDVVAHIERDGWQLDRYPLYRVLPSHVSTHLEEHGFEESEDVVDD